MNTKQLLIKEDNSLIISIISSRSRETGKWLLASDGNIQTMLHRIYISKAKNVTMTLPFEKDIETGQLDEFKELLKRLKLDVKLLHLDWYGRSIEESRQNVSINFDISKYSQVICEFPILLKHQNVVYNWNWTATNSKDEAINRFGKELSIIDSGADVFVLSDVQYNFIDEHMSDTKHLYRSIDVYSREFFYKLFRFYESKNTIEHENAVDKLLNDYPKAVIYSMRVDDPRYKFYTIREFCRGINRPLIVLNYNKTQLPDDVIDASKCGVTTKGQYYYLLSQLVEDNVIFRLETDMHIGLIEQTYFTAATTITAIEKCSIDSYIAEIKNTY